MNKKHVKEVIQAYTGFPVADELMSDLMRELRNKKPKGKEIKAKKDKAKPKNGEGMIK